MTRYDTDRSIERERMQHVLVQGRCAAIDTLDWQLYRVTLTDELGISFPSPDYPAELSTRRWSAYDWVQQARIVEGLDSTQHYVSNFSCELGDTTASVTSYLLAQDQLDADHSTLGGRSIRRFRRVNDGWQITGVVLHPWWTRGRQSIMTTAAEYHATKRARRTAKLII